MPCACACTLAPAFLSSVKACKCRRGGHAEGQRRPRPSCGRGWRSGASGNDRACKAVPGRSLTVQSVWTYMHSLLIYLPADRQLLQRPDAAISAAEGSVCMQQHVWLPAEPQGRCRLSTFSGRFAWRSRSCGCLQSGAAGDSITLSPSKLDPRCEALVFVLSAADSEVALLDLNTPDVLSFEGFSTGGAFSTAVLCLKAAGQYTALQ